MAPQGRGSGYLMAAMAAALAAAVAWWVAGAGAGPGGPTDPVTAAQASRLQALEASLADVSARLARLESAPGHAPGARLAMQRQLEQALEAPEVVAAERERQFVLMDNAFEDETVDARWAPGAERKLDAVGSTDAILAIEPAPPRERRIECRARTCRMEFLFARESDATDWALAYVTGIGGNLREVQYDVRRQPDGSARVVMFGAR
ncbi:hypothetical protein GCM10028862_18210 [Luteimonas pelagia]